MAKKKIMGICHICGNYGELTFEHVPMRAAFNSNPVLQAMTKDIVKSIVSGHEQIERYREEQQSGAGEYSLCGKCNSNTGAWYGNQYLEWCCKGMEKLSKGKPSLIYIYYIYPLAIIKQILAMFCSANHEEFTKLNPEVRKFILDKERKYLSTKYHIYCYFNIENRFRSIGQASMINFDTGRIIPFISEISFPPFGYVMTKGAAPPEKRLIEITHFAKYGYYEMVDMKLELSVLSTRDILPGIYPK